MATSPPLTNSSNNPSSLNPLLMVPHSLSPPSQSTISTPMVDPTPPSPNLLPPLPTPRPNNPIHESSLIQQPSTHIKQYQMLTRFQIGSLKPKQILDLYHDTTTPIEPHNYNIALS